MNRKQQRRAFRRQIAQHRQYQPVQRNFSISPDAPDSPFVADSTPFFDRCETELMGLHHGGRMGLMDLFSWTVSSEYIRKLKFITYVRPEMADGVATPGHLADPCDDPNGYEFGTTTLTLEDFGRYGRKGPDRDIFKAERFCETDPRYRLDGTLITSELEWDMAFAMDALKQDLFRHVITGNSSVPGQFDGIQQWINTGYDSAILDSYVIDWAGNDMDGSGGGTIEVNGEAATQTFDIVDMLLALYRRFKQRIKWSPQLDTQPRRPGDFVLVLPQFLAECLLDKYTCWSVCPGRQYNEANLQTFEARTFRDNLMGGMFGAGEITLDGDRIPLYVYDWETMHGSNRGDMYFMTLNVGNVRIWEAEHLSGAAAAATVREEGHSNYFSTDGGRIIAATYIGNLCKNLKMWLRPRLWSRAPYLQARIMNVECEPILDPLSPDPLKTSFYPVTSFGADTATTG